METGQYQLSENAVGQIGQAVRLVLGRYRDQPPGRGNSPVGSDGSVRVRVTSATLATSATAGATAAGPGVASTSGETVMRVQPAQTISMTPEFQQKVHDNVLRTISRRLGRTPRTP